MALTHTASSSTGVRSAGALCVASGVLGVLLACVNLLYPAAVPREQWSYPFDASVQVVVGLVLTVTHLLTAVGVLALRRRVGGLGAAGRGGLAVAVVGLVALAACELVSAFLGGRTTDDPAATALSTGYGVASLVLVAGSLVGGVAVGRSGWADPLGRWALAASGLVLLLLVTPANISGALVAAMLALAFWSLLFVPLGLALRREEQAGR